MLRTNLDAVPGLRRGLELHSKQGPDLRWNGVVEIQASDGDFSRQALNAGADRKSVV